MQCKTMGSLLYSCGAAQSRLVSEPHKICDEEVSTAKESGSVLIAYVFASRKRGGVAEWLASPPLNRPPWVRFPLPLYFFLLSITEASVT